MPDPSRQDFGGSLREARERAGITLQDISASTKISVLTLAALERNDISRLPGGVFTRAFVRSYAQEIGLDPDETLDQFLERFPDAAGEAALSDPAGTGVESQGPSGWSRALHAVAWLLPIVAGVLYFGFLGPSRVAVPTGRGPAAGPRSPGPEAQLGRVGGQFPGEGAAGAEAVPEVGQAAPVNDRDAAPTAGGAEASAETTVPEGFLRVALEATGECWVSLKANGASVFSGLMGAGDSREFDVSGEALLTVGNAGAIGFTINGEAIPSLGGPGKVATVRFSPDTFRELLEPR